MRFTRAGSGRRKRGVAPVLVQDEKLERGLVGAGGELVYGVVLAR